MPENNETPAQKPEKETLKKTFQWLAAATPVPGEAPSTVFQQVGYTWDYAKAWIGSKIHHKPKL